MSHQVFIEGKRIRLDVKDSIGKGGEAEIFEIPTKLLKQLNFKHSYVVKLFKQPGHPDFLTLEESAAAKTRIEEHQTKLLSFPKLPRRVVAPVSVVRKTAKKDSPILGYAMPFLRGCSPLYQYSRKKFRTGIDNNIVTEIFKDLHQTVKGIHRTKVIIGDFNDLNVLINPKNRAYLIDADSFQFAQFQCRMFTLRFVDPLLCDPSKLVLSQAHNQNSDWYAFTVMLMQPLLYVGPYGGIYKPKDKSKKLPHDARPLHRITVFDDEVKYPKPAIPYKVLSDELLDYFIQTFKKDFRGPFPAALLESMRWQRCSDCNIEHARSSCPNCATMVAGIVKQVVVVRGKVVATRIFETTGNILHACNQLEKLIWICHEEDTYKRGEVRVKDPKTISFLNGSLDPKTRYRISNDKIFVAKTGVVVTLSTDEKISVDNFRGLPIFDTNSKKLFYLSGGQLLRQDEFGPLFIGNVLTGKTLLWVGEKFGFGYYQLGATYNGFIFDTVKTGLVDIDLPKIPGQLIDSTCCFSKNLAWIFFSTQERGRTHNYCLVVERNGQILGMTKIDTANPDKHTWLVQIRGGFAVGNHYYAPTDEGIIRVEIARGAFHLKHFADTEPFVDSASRLFPAKDGIFVVGFKEILKLQIT